MNKSKFVGVKSHLLAVQYNFQESNKEDMIEVTVEDTIEINEINNEFVNTVVCRKLLFNKLENTYLNVSFDMSIKLSEPITKEEFIKEIKKSQILMNLYSKISLIISNITNMCPLGAIITPPIYHDIVIK